MSKGEVIRNYGRFKPYRSEAGFPILERALRLVILEGYAAKRYLPGTFSHLNVLPFLKGLDFPHIFNSSQTW